MRKLNDKDDFSFVNDDFLLGADSFLESLQTDYAYDFTNVLYHREKFHFDDDAIQRALDNLRNNPTTESGTGNTAVATDASGNQYIDGILIGANWSDPTITYAFTVSSAAYDYDDTGIELLPTTFSALNAQQEGAVHFALSDSEGLAAAAGFSVEGFTTTNFDSLGNADTTAHMRFANTDSVATARVGDFPGSLVSAPVDDDGDVWLGTGQGGILLTPDTGTYGWTTILHEIGHALGLKHSQDAGYSYGAVPADMDAMEFTVMSYRSYVGGPSSGGYTNEQFGYAQTFMMLDIAALQYIYGADFTTNDGDTVYSWDEASGDTLIDGEVAISPGGNRIFATIWDGGGYDTYDLSAYTTDLQIDLNPGKSSLFSQAQRANLGGANFAAGNIYNAMLFEGDTRSLIESAIGGTGDDTIAGNSANNLLVGGAGNDTVSFYSDTGGAIIILSLGVAFGVDSGFDSIVSFENAIGGSGNDIIAGTNKANLIEGGEGDDIMFGGRGRDTLSYENDAGGVDVNLMTGVALGVDSGFDIFSSFENVIGGSGDDNITGKNGRNTLLANDGDDTVDGKGGADIIFGGLGDDILDGGNGSDLIYGDENLPVETASIGFGSGQVIRPADAGNTFTDSAIDITNDFSLAPDADIFDAETIPHLSITGTSDAGAGQEYHVYSITLDNPGTTITLDMDYTASDGSIVPEYDSYILFVNDALSIVSSNDDSSLAGDPGTTSARDSFLSFTVEVPGTYYIFVAQWDYTDQSGFLRLDEGLSYELQVSVDENLSVQGDDVINGGNGHDELYGDGGDDVIDGGRGRDIIDGGAGNDDLTGGVGADTFVFGDDFGLDAILDFGRGNDLIDFTGNSDLNSFADVLAAANQVGNDILVILDADNIIVIEDYDVSNLTEDDFFFGSIAT